MRGARTRRAIELSCDPAPLFGLILREGSDKFVYMSLHTRHFTLEEARFDLKSILPDLDKLVDLKRILDGRGYDVYRHRYFGGAGPNGTGHYPPELEELVEIVKSFDEKGISVKDLDEGLIDFPHFKENGEEVYLCYKLGEEDILFWHPIQSGFSGRRSLKDPDVGRGINEL